MAMALRWPAQIGERAGAVDRAELAAADRFERWLGTVELAADASHSDPAATTECAALQPQGDYPTVDANPHGSRTPDARACAEF